MQLIVCNCNAYGSIDTRQPILFTQNDYRTATRFGHRYIPPVTQSFYKTKPYTPGINNKLYLETKNACISETATSYDNKSQKWDPNKKAGLPINANKVQYMRNFKEKVFQNPPPPLLFPLSETKGVFQGQDFNEPSEHFYNPDFNRIDSIPRPVGDTAEIKIEDGGSMRLLDSYATTTNLDYIPFNENKTRISRNHITTFYEKDKAHELKKNTVKEPMHDKVIFKNKTSNRITPALVYRVPHSGITSEHEDNFKSPTRSNFSSRIFYCEVERPHDLPYPSMWNTVVVPNMYCTEYSHIGSGLPLEYSVNQNIQEKNRFKHTPCKNIEE